MTVTFTPAICPQCILALAAGRNLIMVAGQGATATIWTPDLLQTLAQARQVTIFTNKGLGLSTDAATPYASTVAGVYICTYSLHVCFSQCAWSINSYAPNTTG